MLGHRGWRASGAPVGVDVALRDRRVVAGFGARGGALAVGDDGRADDAAACERVERSNRIDCQRRRVARVAGVLLRPVHWWGGEWGSMFRAGREGESLRWWGAG